LGEGRKSLGPIWFRYFGAEDIIEKAQSWRVERRV
jgi:hypothetical protein